MANVVANVYAWATLTRDRRADLSRRMAIYAAMVDRLDQQIGRVVEDLKAAGETTLVNLASNEYFNALDRKQLQADIVQPVFKDFSSGQYRVLSFFAKTARGRMAAWILKNQVESPDQLADFKLDGYRYSKKESTPEKPVFLRKKK